MNNLSDSFNIVQGPSKEKIQEMANEKKEAARIHGETLILNKTRVENNIKALREMGWKANLDIVDACRDSWNWQKNNPKGYDKD